jgi:hypothetical protein
MIRSTCIVVFLMSQLLSVAVSATEVHGVAFDPSPGATWRCGLTNEDLPGLKAEHMQQPIAAGCTRGDATAYAVIVDLSDARQAMSAEQMAADAEDQLPPEWKLQKKSYDVVSLASGSSASYSQLVGKGDGFTFTSGQKPTAAISINVPLLFQDDAGTSHQAVAVFRVRALLPGSAAQQKEVLAELDQSLRAWAGSAHPASGHAITARKFEQTRAKPEPDDPTTPATAPAPRPQQNGNDRIAAAIDAAMNGRATDDDLAVLENVDQQFAQPALGGMSHALLEDAHRAAQQKQQEQILAAVVENAKERAGDVLSRFLIAAIEKGDAGAAVATIRIAEKRGWILRNASPAAIDAIAGAVMKRALPFVPAAGDRFFFELASADLLPLVQRVRNVPAIGEIARPERDHWRMRDRRGASKASYLVRQDNGIGLLERNTSDSYRYRPLTSLLDVAAVEP